MRELGPAQSADLRGEERKMGLGGKKITAQDHKACLWWSLDWDPTGAFHQDLMLLSMPGPKPPCAEGNPKSLTHIFSGPGLCGPTPYVCLF